MYTAIPFAQSAFGRLAGVAFDTSEAVMPGVSVTLVSPATGTSLTTVTTDSGTFLFPQVPPGTYTATLTLAGFKTATFPGIEIHAGVERALTARLEVGALAETVTVSRGGPPVQTTSSQVADTIEQRQIVDLPLDGRNTLELVRLQAGVPGIVGRAPTAINGGRPTWTQVTQDGINVQDNFIRTNALDFAPTHPTPASVGEVAITTAVPNADTVGGASMVRLITPSGTNVFRGNTFGFSRTDRRLNRTALDEASGLDKPDFRRRQLGGWVSGPIKRNRLFFFTDFEGYRLDTQQSQLNVIPLHDDLLQGTYRYLGADGLMRAANLMQLSGLSLDPVVQRDILTGVPRAAAVNTYDVGDSTASRPLNTAGYRFLQQNITERNQGDVRLDFALTPGHRFEAIYAHLTDTDDRPDTDVVHQRPAVAVSSTARRYVGAWQIRGAHMTNEVRGGGNLVPSAFTNSDPVQDVSFLVPLITNRRPSFQPQGRDTRTFQYSDTGSWFRGAHDVQFGGQFQQARVHVYDYAGVVPSVAFGFSPSAPATVQLDASSFPGGIGAADLASANSWLAFLSGRVSAVARTFQASGASPGFTAGTPFTADYTLGTTSAFVQDNWRWTGNLTVQAGLRWEYYTPLREDHGLALMPQLRGRSVRDTLLDPSGTVALVAGPFYDKDLNNFGPHLGVAWDPFKSGRTAVRAGYSLTFVNEDTISVGINAATANPGLDTRAVLNNLYTPLAAGVPLPPTPAFAATRSYADQLAISPASVAFAIDPHIRQPQVHQVSAGLSRELPWSIGADVRYVGSFGRGLWRGIDLNQLRLDTAFLDDFRRARANGFLARQASGAFNPAFDPQVPGSVPLTMLSTFGTDLLANAAARTLVETGQAAALADFFMTSAGPALGEQARRAFLPNPGIYAADLIENGGFSDYHALQVEVRRRLRDGFFGQVNYTLAHTRSNSEGLSQSRFEPFLDNARPELNEGRSNFEVTHIINANGIAELPFGPGKRWFTGGGRWREWLIAGWQASGVLHWQSGAPISILAGRGTFNRVGRSSAQTAQTALDVDALKRLLGVHVLDGALYWIDPRVIDPRTGRGVGADTLTNAPGFDGQVFFNPMAGEVGTLPIRAFDGPSQWVVDGSMSKRVRLRGKLAMQLRLDVYNLFNTVNLLVGDYDINSTSFGRITHVNTPARRADVSVNFGF